MEKQKAILHLSALDTWFFRESRPIESAGASELDSVFPPPPRTVLGALRTLIGDRLGVDWSRLENNQKVRAQIGYGDDLGALQLDGLWLVCNDVRYYPIPSHILFRINKEQQQRELTQLQLGSAVETSLCKGKVRLPCLKKSDKDKGAKSFEQTWVNTAGLQAILEGRLPNAGQLLHSKQLLPEDAVPYTTEPRLGIARDNASGSVVESMLYQTRHLRIHADLKIEMQIQHGADIELPSSALVRLGGEGRQAHMQKIEPMPDAAIELPTPNKQTQGLLLVFISPAYFVKADDAHSPDWLPNGFRQTTDEQGIAVWDGKLNEIPLRIHAAVMGKTQREGGWDQAEHKPRPVQSLIPAGSVYYVSLPPQAEKTLVEAISALHDKYIDDNQQFGRGRIVCGLWQQEQE